MAGWLLFSSSQKKNGVETMLVVILCWCLTLVDTVGAAGAAAGGVASSAVVADANTEDGVVQLLEQEQERQQEQEQQQQQQHHHHLPRIVRSPGASGVAVPRRTSLKFAFRGYDATTTTAIGAGKEWDDEMSVIGPDHRDRDHRDRGLVEDVFVSDTEAVDCVRYDRFDTDTQPQTVPSVTGMVFFVGSKLKDLTINGLELAIKHEAVVNGDLGVQLWIFEDSDYEETGLPPQAEWKLLADTQLVLHPQDNNRALIPASQMEPLLITRLKRMVMMIRVAGPFLDYRLNSSIKAKDQAISDTRIVFFAGSPIPYELPYRSFPTTLDTSSESMAPIFAGKVYMASEREDCQPGKPRFINTKVEFLHVINATLAAPDYRLIEEHVNTAVDDLLLNDPKMGEWHDKDGLSMPGPSTASFRRFDGKECVDNTWISCHYLVVEIEWKHRESLAPGILQFETFLHAKTFSEIIRGKLQPTVGRYYLGYEPVKAKVDLTFQGVPSAASSLDEAQKGFIQAELLSFLNAKMEPILAGVFQVNLNTGGGRRRRLGHGLRRGLEDATLSGEILGGQIALLENKDFALKIDSTIKDTVADLVAAFKFDVHLPGSMAENNRYQYFSALTSVSIASSPINDPSLIDIVPGEEDAGALTNNTDGVGGDGDGGGDGGGGDGGGGGGTPSNNTDGGGVMDDVGNTAGDAADAASGFFKELDPLYIYIAAAAAGGLFILFCLCCFCRRRASKKKKDNKDNKYPEKNTKDTKETPPPAAAAPAAKKEKKPWFSSSNKKKTADDEKKKPVVPPPPPTPSPRTSQASTVGTDYSSSLKHSQQQERSAPPPAIAATSSVKQQPPTKQKESTKTSSTKANSKQQKPTPMSSSGKTTPPPQRVNRPFSASAPPTTTKAPAAAAPPPSKPSPAASAPPQQQQRQATAPPPPKAAAPLRASAPPAAGRTTVNAPTPRFTRPQLDQMTIKRLKELLPLQQANYQPVDKSDLIDHLLRIGAVQLIPSSPMINNNYNNQRRASAAGRVVAPPPPLSSMQQQPPPPQHAIIPRMTRQQLEAMGAKDLKALLNPQDNYQPVDKKDLIDYVIRVKAVELIGAPPPPPPMDEQQASKINYNKPPPMDEQQASKINYNNAVAPPPPPPPMDEQQASKINYNNNYSAATAAGPQGTTPPVRPKFTRVQLENMTAKQLKGMLPPGSAGYNPVDKYDLVDYVIRSGAVELIGLNSAHHPVQPPPRRASLVGAAGPNAPQQYPQPIPNAPQQPPQPGPNAPQQPPQPPPRRASLVGAAAAMQGGQQPPPSHSAPPQQQRPNSNGQGPTGPPSLPTRRGSVGPAPTLRRGSVANALVGNNDVASGKPRFTREELLSMGVHELKTHMDANDTYEPSSKVALVDHLIQVEAVNLVVAYKMSYLQSLGPGKLRKTIMDAGVNFDSRYVVEKNDMIRVFHMSGKLRLIPEDNVPMTPSGNIRATLPYGVSPSGNYRGASTMPPLPFGAPPMSPMSPDNHAGGGGGGGPSSMAPLPFGAPPMSPMGPRGGGGGGDSTSPIRNQVNAVPMSPGGPMPARNQRGGVSRQASTSSHHSFRPQPPMHTRSASSTARQPGGSPRRASTSNTRRGSMSSHGGSHNPYAYRHPSTNRDHSNRDHSNRDYSNRDLSNRDLSARDYSYRDVSYRDHSDSVDSNPSFNPYNAYNQSFSHNPSRRDVSERRDSMESGRHRLSQAVPRDSMAAALTPSAISGRPRFTRDELVNMNAQQLKALMPEGDVYQPINKMDLIEHLIGSNAVELIVCYKMSELQAMSTVQLRNCVRNSGVTYDERYVVEKRDFIRVFQSSGKLRILPE